MTLLMILLRKRHLCPGCRSFERSGAMPPLSGVPAYRYQ